MKLPIATPFPPMEAKIVSEIPVGDDWEYEPKWDGFRCLAFRDGAEVELTFVPFDGLELIGTTTWTSTEYEEFFEQTGGGPVDRSMNTFAYVPEWTYRLGARWRLPFGLGADSETYIRADYMWQDGIYHSEFNSPLIYILLAAGVVSVIIGDSTDAGFILLIVTLNAALGAYQEWKAERSAASLQQLIKIKARVDRDGATVEIPAEELVPGDIVHLESGGRVPADLRLLDVNGLKVDESLLTGESLAVRKHAAREIPAAMSAPGGEDTAQLFAGTLLVRGSGRMRVLATGPRIRTSVFSDTRPIELPPATQMTPRWSW